MIKTASEVHWHIALPDSTYQHKTKVGPEGWLNPGFEPGTSRTTDCSSLNLRTDPKRESYR
ncbi:hypothetical protein BJ508DRAFT_109227 [Ascobolus immersus RN42]|uniref:Uncharacterized protein n=1 Tax=Ascobolus immersus RN42 TaxID=1160509 RepID=A0A3N4H8S8_ASCIM|nr:hypothetical protein BJ508DRAFT_109227 [Ascobolus immersus RN42]